MATNKTIDTDAVEIIDPEAVEIGKLFDQAKVVGGGSVTDKRKFSRKISPNRNGSPIETGEVWRQAREGHGASAAVTNDKFFADELWDTRNDPDSCRHCGERFALGAMRYPVATGTRHGGGWGLASVCMDCFKCASKEETTGFHRFQRPCHGCGEPMLTPMQRIFRFQVCCNRCYQRYYRERRRGRRSVMDWKGWAPQCECCGRDFYKRRDAQFCSNKCRQWTHRRRIADR